MRLSEHLADVRDRVRRAGRVWVGCDFDGTLAPLTDDPWAAAPEAHAVAALGRLAGCPAAAVAIISGRSLDDLKPRVPVADIAFAGNHGAEIDAPGLILADPVATAASPALAAAHARLSASRLSTVGGVTIEHKRYSLAVDYRPVPVPDRLRIKADVETAAEGLPSLYVHHAMNGSEVRVIGGWNKGTASRRLWLHQAGAGAVPVFLGDDLTDEDAFAALPDGVTVCVGDHPTAARYRVLNPKAVATFLGWLADECEGIGPPNR